MRTRWKILIALTAIVVIAALALSRTSQPTGVFAQTYQGKTLKQWLDQEVSESARDNISPQEQEATRKTILMLTSHHVPELIAALDYDAGPRRAKLKSSLGWLPAPIFSWLEEGPLRDRKAQRRDIALLALITLGTNISYALPQLEAIASRASTAVASRVNVVIESTGTNGLPFLLQTAGDEKNPQRQSAVYMLKMLAHRMPQDLSSAIPVLEQCATNADARIASASKQALFEITTALHPPAANSADAQTNTRAPP